VPDWPGQLGFLKYLCDAIAAKVTGVPEPQVREPGVASDTNLLGLLKHLTAVERFSFLGEQPGSWPRTFKPTAKDTTGSVLDGYRRAVAESNAVTEACTDLTGPARTVARRCAGSGPT
jgi:hypothetical protein